MRESRLSIRRAEERQANQAALQNCTLSPDSRADEYQMGIRKPFLESGTTILRAISNGPTRAPTSCDAAMAPRGNPSDNHSLVCTSLATTFHRFFLSGVGLFVWSCFTRHTCRVMPGVPLRFRYRQLFEVSFLEPPTTYRGYT